jgi:hypothetical protein
VLDFEGVAEFIFFVRPTKKMLSFVFGGFGVFVFGLVAGVAAASPRGAGVKDFDGLAIGAHALLIVHRVLGAAVVLMLMTQHLGLGAAGPGGPLGSDNRADIRARRQLPTFTGPYGAGTLEPRSVTVRRVDAVADQSVVRVAIHMDAADLLKPRRGGGGCTPRTHRDASLDGGQRAAIADRLIGANADRHVDSEKAGVTSECDDRCVGFPVCLFYHGYPQQNSAFQFFLTFDLQLFLVYFHMHKKIEMRSFVLVKVSNG